ncbi:hypothetical protein C8J56DRAFT_911732 [Mycena floridula]|nr:hypothetical protein C8J56DRAFT_911732 [Mycena floridula]
MKLAILGGGPSGFYAASRILAHGNHSIRIHMYDRLWAPHGLVRYGVAPDHPEVKNCTHKFDAVAQDPRFKFFGNVNVSMKELSRSPISHSLDIPLTSMMENYTHILFATGCTVPKSHQALSPSWYCIPALSLVHWYTLHPAQSPIPPLENISHVTLIGQGNVSLDVARMLLTPPANLAKYDVPETVLQVLERSKVRHVSILGRRGPFEAAFTTKELREMMNLPDAAMVPISPFFLNPPSETKPSRQQSRTLDLLRKGSQNVYGTTAKTWSLDFYRSPLGLTIPSSSSEMAELTVAHTVVDSETQRAIPTGETSTLSTSLVVTSLGFEAEADNPYFDLATGHLRTERGRVIDSTGATVKNVYASGWAGTGAKGVLASTMIDAYAVADQILLDLADQSIEFDEQPPSQVIAGLKDNLVTTYDDWKLIDEAETKLGEKQGKERERLGWTQAQDVRAKSST